jgi:hypothetical protein
LVGDPAFPKIPNGNGSGSDTTIDSLEITILAPGVSAVQTTSESKTKFTVAYNSNDYNIEVLIPVSVHSQTIEFFNLLGQAVDSMKIDLNSARNELPASSLSPGLYFARLSDQVAKFIVPPR